jgi:hypothetical protein
MYLGSRGRGKGVSAVSVLAAILLVTGGASVVYIYETLPAGSGAASTTSLSSHNETTFSTSTSTSTYLPPTTTQSSSQNASGWQEWAVANITLGYNRTQAYIHDAYNYSFFASQTGSNPVLVSALVSTFGPQIINGNWTTGYNFTFSYHSELNVTVRYTPPAKYQIISFAVQNFTLGGVYWSIPAYNSTQQQAISIALANASVKSYLTQYPSYVDGAFLFPAANKTFGGDYLILFDQLTGGKILGVFVNLNAGAVVSTYGDTRATKTCFSNGICYTSPWGS